MTPIDAQDVIRMNRDTLYSSGCSTSTPQVHAFVDGRQKELAGESRIA